MLDGLRLWIFLNGKKKLYEASAIFLILALIGRFAVHAYYAKSIISGHIGVHRIVIIVFTVSTVIAIFSGIKQSRELNRIMFFWCCLEDKSQITYVFLENIESFFISFTGIFVLAGSSISDIAFSCILFVLLYFIVFFAGFYILEKEWNKKISISRAFPAKNHGKKLSGHSAFTIPVKYGITARYTFIIITLTKIAAVIAAVYIALNMPYKENVYFFLWGFLIVLISVLNENYWFNEGLNFTLWKSTGIRFFAYYGRQLLSAFLYNSFILLFVYIVFTLDFTGFIILAVFCAFTNAYWSAFFIYYVLYVDSDSPYLRALYDIVAIIVSLIPLLNIGVLLYFYNKSRNNWECNQ